MLIDTESDEGKALVALAKFGWVCLDEMDQAGWIECKVDGMAGRLGLVDAENQPTNLATLPEGL